MSVSDKINLKKYKKMFGIKTELSFEVSSRDTKISVMKEKYTDLKGKYNNCCKRIFDLNLSN